MTESPFPVIILDRWGGNHKDSKKRCRAKKIGTGKISIERKGEKQSHGQKEGNIGI